MKLGGADLMSALEGKYMKCPQDLMTCDFKCVLLYSVGRNVINITFV